MKCYARAALSLLCLTAVAGVAGQTPFQPNLPSASSGFKIPNPIGKDPLLEKRGNFFGLNIPYLFQFKHQPYGGIKDLSSSMFNVKLLNGLLFDLDHDRLREPLSGNLIGKFTVKAFGAKIYDYADELLSGNGWFANRPKMPTIPPFNPQQWQQNMQAQTNQFMQNSQAQLNQFANRFPAQMQANFQRFNRPLQPMAV